ncbi:helix-turn-helix domain-containing protein [Microbispora sp. ATCC PTA-5024]|uniref:helix-turn-helix domain-containing protein n=1 Tax=Microbispora sp. ATCC PTA-5024 TaxID=316330 RepID=UPI0003DBEC7E|nr:AraC family transcriptional regulator [Microbispora sp. ATCC PTA-5024]ETK37138.1 AraC family transcriptional regulator [Microbispora sp. ATCC PTA-5024]
MDDVITEAVLRVVESMQENLGEQLTIDEMARTAMFSKFHFSRVFQRVTGLSPGRFLSAVRLREAKRLLTATTLTVTDISHRVGYSSVGTFSSRFTSSVGVSPTRYRHLDRLTSPAAAADRRPARVPTAMTVRGDISSPLEGRPVFAGLFPDRILEGWPVSYTIIHTPGPYVLEDVPEGCWHLIAQSAADGHEGALNLPASGDEALCIGRHGPITVQAGAGPEQADLALRPMNAFDPPVLLALRELLPAGLSPALAVGR